MEVRKETINRETKETNITIALNIDGEGNSKIDTGIGILNHMLELFAFWGRFDLNIVAKGDIEKVDIHHTNEDVGIVLGQTFKKALGNKAGINRSGDASVPMENITASVAVDISGRSSYSLKADKSVVAPAEHEEKGYTFKDAEHLLDAFAKNLGMNLNIIITSLTVSPDLHTSLEPIFKALGKALDEATQIDPRRKGIPSTKGVID